MSWEMVVGLEVHCQLKTRTKLFCPCPTDVFGAPANSRVCPVCTGQPGTLPVLNRRAVELAFRAALALGCRLREESVFARKNYFYPDLPKGYQISQYEEPFSENGFLDISAGSAGGASRRIRITRIHMEEDAGKLLHAVGSQALDHSLVDFNRAGVPLIEIVSEPDMRTSDEAYQYLTALKAVLQYADASNCDMEKGEMRCDANVSVRRPGEALGTKVEIKNMNSFRGVKDALDHEFGRQTRALEEGKKLVQETRLWDSARGVTEPMRSKEEAHDYRYFPDPDLVPLRAAQELVAAVKASLPELPPQRRKRFVELYKIPDYDAGVLTSERALADYFEACVKASGNGSAKAAANFVMGDLLAKLNESKKSVAEAPIPPERLGELVALVQKGTLSSKMAKDVFARMWETGKGAAELVSSLGLAKVADEGRIARWVEEAMAANPKAVADLKGGKQAAAGAIVGAVMRLSQGKADPAVVNRIIREKAG